MSKSVAWVTLVALALFTSGCTGAIWGNLVVLGITVGIFFGTLSLGRTSPRSAEASSSTQSSSTRQG